MKITIETRIQHYMTKKMNITRSDFAGTNSLKECHTHNELNNDKTGLVQWIEVNLKSHNNMYVGGF